MGKKKKEHVTFDRMLDKKSRINKAHIIRQSKNNKMPRKPSKIEPMQ